MYNHAPEDYVCLFCLAAQGIENEHVYTRRTDVVYRDNAVTAITSSHQRPNNRGQVVIFSNQHFENIYDLPVHLAVKIHELARSVAMAMKVAYACEGTSTMQHNEPAGSQDVWHYHLHLFPRYTDDGLYSSRRELMAVDERAEYAQKLRAKLGDGQSSSMDEFSKAYDQLKSDVHRRLQAGKFDERLLEVARNALKGALSVEGIVISRTLHNHLLRDILKDTLDEVLKKL